MDSSDKSPSKRGKQIVQVVISLAVVGLVFFYALPKFADFSKVLDSIKSMTWLELGTLALIAIWNIVTYWFVMVASLPGSNYWQAMKVNQTSTAVSNTLPGGSAIGIAITYAMYTAYGFSRNEISLSILVSGIWNNFVKLGMPVIALVLLAVSGKASGAIFMASLIGVAILVGAIVLFALTLRSEQMARKVGAFSTRAINRVLRVIRRKQVGDLSDSFARFRRDAIDLLRRRWVPLTVATVVSHLSLFLVLLLALRHLGVSQQDVSWIEVLSAFSLIRLLTALPITPGGLGVVEFGMSAALVAAGGNKPAVVAAVLIWRLLTYVAPIPFGLLAYVQYKRNTERRRIVADQRREARLAGGAP
jgi:uncharacterized protein (TIRG00374 family)